MSTSRRSKPEPVLGPRELNRATLARQLLLARSKLAPLAAIEALAGMQAQVPRPPYLGLWTRLAKFSRDDLHALLVGKHAVRATMMRATIHLVSARDYLAWRNPLQPMLTAIMASIARDRLEGLAIPKLKAFAQTKLPLTFEELRKILVKRFPDYDERALGYAVRCHLPVVMVPSETRWTYAGNAAFACATTWLEAGLSPDATPHALVRRYLAAFGPATIKDAQAWSALRNLAPIFEALRPELVTFRDDRGRELFDLPDAPRPPAETPAPIRFIPDYDNLVLAHDDRRRVIDDEHRPKLVTKNLMVRPTFLVDGRVAGMWSSERVKAKATLTLEPFGKLTKAVRSELKEEGEALLRFTEPDATAFAVKC